MLSRIARTLPFHGRLIAHFTRGFKHQVHISTNVTPKSYYLRFKRKNPALMLCFKMLLIYVLSAFIICIILPGKNFYGQQSGKVLFMKRKIDWGFIWFLTQANPKPEQLIKYISAMSGELIKLDIYSADALNYYFTSTIKVLTGFQEAIPNQTKAAWLVHCEWLLQKIITNEPKLLLDSSLLKHYSWLISYAANGMKANADLKLKQFEEVVASLYPIFGYVSEYGDEETVGVFLGDYLKMTESCEQRSLGYILLTNALRNQHFKRSLVEIVSKFKNAQIRKQVQQILRRVDRLYQSGLTPK